MALKFVVAIANLIYVNKATTGMKTHVLAYAPPTWIPAQKTTTGTANHADASALL